MPAARTKVRQSASAGVGMAANGIGTGGGPTRIWPALQHIHQNPGQSGRQIAQAIGVKDEGQMSRLLHRLRRLKMIENSAAFRQTAHWTVTERGIEALHIVGYYPYLNPGAVNARIEDDKA